MDIEYREAFDELRSKDTFRGQQWFGERQHLVEEYSWAVPTEEAIIYLAEFDHLLEIGAGNGYWAHLIEEAGGNVTAIDAEPPDETYTNVVEAKAQWYSDEIEGQPVLMVWPPYDERMARVVAKQEPSHICYVGEPRGGCTGGDEFFDILERKYGLVGKLDIPSYAGIHDDFFHYVRKV